MTNPTMSAEERMRLFVEEHGSIFMWDELEEQIRQAEQAAYERAARACEEKLGDASDSVTGRTLQRMFDEMAADVRALAQEPEEVG